MPRDNCKVSVETAEMSDAEVERLSAEVSWKEDDD